MLRPRGFRILLMGSAVLSLKYLLIGWHADMLLLFPPIPCVTHQRLPGQSAYHSLGTGSAFPHDFLLGRTVVQ